MIEGYVDVSFLFEIASCYRAVGLADQADNCYKSIISLDSGNYEARVGLANPRHHPEGDKTVHRNEDNASPIQRRKGIRHTGGRITPSTRTDPLMLRGRTMLLAPRSVRQSLQYKREDKFELREREINDIFLHQQILSTRTKDYRYTIEWMSATRSLLQAFRNNRLFYPYDRHHRFLGYSKMARFWATRPKLTLGALQQLSNNLFGRKLMSRLSRQ